MRRYPILTSLALAALLPMRSAATDYYIAPTGNDNNSGTSQSQAWKTLERLEQMQYALQPGDRVLLKRGGVYRGTLPVSSSGTSASPVVFGAYGTGNAPVISGSDLVTGWQPWQGNIWRAPVEDEVKQVYVAGSVQTLARFPNSGWLRMDQGTSTSLHDDDLDQANGYWNGATAVIRASNWNYDLAEVSGFNNGTLTFPTIFDNPGNYQWGYFLQDKLSELDAPGEWYHDAAAGMLYFQAPGNADPNTLQVEAAVRPAGAPVAWGRSWVRIQDLAFEHQTNAGVDNGGATHITVSNCRFSDLYHGIRSAGSWNNYENSLFERTYATAALLIDDHTAFTGNTLEDIAMRPGAGETSWGYNGVRTIGPGNTVAENIFHTVGYTGIVADQDALIEHNVLHDCLSLLNDGAAIAFDNADGMIIRGNIVMDVQGDLESAAPDFPNHEPICHGIYFGNTSIKNTLVEKNTVARCASSGIHVDHTMASTGNAIKDNTLFDNGIQLSVSDLSTDLGPAAAPPYYLPSYNEVYSGNTMYCLNKDQFCMRQYNCHAAVPIDFGTFSGNRYHNPYNELDIRVHNTFTGEQRNMTLAKWQATMNEDAGSTASPLRLNSTLVTGEIGGEQVQNGTFNNNVNGWSGWPTNAQVTQDDAYLDNGALKAYLPNADMYPEFSLRSPISIQAQQGAWYRLSFSLQSSAEGQLSAALKGESQVTGIGTIGSRDYPFGPDRRDIEFIFQASATDDAMVQFTNTVQNPMYWLDNVSVKKVQVQQLDPNNKQILLVNDQATGQSFPIIGCWEDLNGEVYTGQVDLAAYSSIILVHQDGDPCDLATSVVIGNTPQGPVVAPNPAAPGAELRLSTPVLGPVLLVTMDGKHIPIHPMDGQRLALPRPLAQGLYMLEITALDGTRSVAKLMIR